MISYIDDDTFDTFMGGVRSANDQMALLNQFNSGASSFIGKAKALHEASKDVILNYDFDGLRRKVTSIYRRLKHVGDVDIIRPLKTISEFQNAKGRMQRWVMANPFLYEEFLNSRHYGYSNTYVPTDRNVAPTERQDYKIVTNGLAVTTDTTTYYPTHLDVMVEGVEQLSFTEKLDISLAWLHAKHLYLLGGDDPFSPYNASL